MKKAIERLLILNLILSIIISSQFVYMSCVPVKAASKKTAALKEYKKILNSSNSNSTFFVYDLNHDGTPELLMHNSEDGSYLHLYTYYNGKVIENSVSYLFEYYKKGSVFRCGSLHYGIFSEGINKLVKGKVKTVASNSGAMDGETSYYIRGKKVSKKKYTSYVNKLTKGSKAKEIKYHKATTANINKYVK